MSYYESRNENTVPLVVALLLVASIFVIGFVKCNGEYSGRNKEIAEKEANKWAREMNMQPIGVSCSGKDSDNDGYVSCSINTEKGVVNVECVAAYQLASGCRPMKFINNLNNNSSR